MKKFLNYFMVMALAFSISTFTLTSCGDDDKDEPNVPEEEVGGATGSEKTDVLSGTSWRGVVDDETVVLKFYSNGKFTETALGETTDCTYIVDGSYITISKDAWLYYCYGPKYRFNQTSSRLTLTNDLNETLTFNKL